jgi:hypothetical protein
VLTRLHFRVKISGGMYLDFILIVPLIAHISGLRITLGVSHRLCPTHKNIMHNDVDLYSTSIMHNDVDLGIP